jgi:hypothetical protein
MERFTTSFPLSSESPFNGGLSQHDFRYRHLDSRGLLRCAYPTRVFAVALASPKRTLLLHALPTCFAF